MVIRLQYISTFKAPAFNIYSKLCDFEQSGCKEECATVHKVGVFVSGLVCSHNVSDKNNTSLQNHTSTEVYCFVIELIFIIPSMKTDVFKHFK